MEANLHLTEKSPSVYVIGGLLYGDEGKGTTVEYISKETSSKLVVRYNGGPQAAHHIVTPHGDFHCFSQFGSATFMLDVHTLLSKYMVIYPQTMLREAKKLIERHKITDLWNRMHIDTECFIITPYHQLINRISEILRDSKKHGSTGLGVGTCTDEAFFSHPDFFPLGNIFYKIDKKNKKKFTTFQIKDLFDKKILTNKLKSIISEKLEYAKNLIKNFDKNSHFIPEYLEIYRTNNSENDLKISLEKEKLKIIQDANLLLKQTSEEFTFNTLYNFFKKFHDDYSHTFIDGNQYIKEEIEKGKSVIFEGAQGALLDRVYGIFPHLTKSLCSDTYAISILNDVREKLKFIESEFENFKIKKIGILRAYSSRHGSGPFVTLTTSWSDHLKEQHNMHSKWQGEFKVGPFDLIAARYGIEIFKPDFISFTCVDKLVKAGESNKEFQNFPICENYLMDLEISSEQKKILNKKDLFEIDQLNNHNMDENICEIIKIKEIKKRKIEDAYCSFDLLKILKDAKPLLKNLGEFEKNEEIEYKYLDLLIKNKEKLVDKFNFDSAYKEVSKFLSIIEVNLKIKIGILSFGPTHNDKLCVLDRNLLFA